MKFLYFPLVLLSHRASAADRKVPPRTPNDRIKTLQRFLGDWIDDNIGETRAGRASNFANRKFFGEGDPDASKLILAYTAVNPDFGVPKCSYYNPANLNHGGPRLSYEPAFSERKKQSTSRRRIRREMSDDELETFLASQMDLVGRLPGSGHEHSSLGRRLDEQNVAVIRSRVDFFDMYELALEMGRSLNAFERLSANPDQAWKQLRTGYLKWVARYTADCPKERNEGAHSTTLMEYFEKLRMLKDCLNGKVPTATTAQTRVQFVFGEGTPYRQLYKEKLSVDVEAISCSAV